MSDERYWYKDAIFYELRVRSFYDSDGDGIGDLKGLAQRLDYLQDLGVTTLWLLPLYPSPLRDDGYDIADYTTVHPAVGTLRDFKAFLRAAHERGLRVVTELVLNHTSDQHPWFQRARRAPPGSPQRDFYVWSDNPQRYKDARIIFQDFETSNWSWDPVAQSYFWHRFYSHQPDLNFENPEVQKALLDVVDHWFEMGVDGLRLDAVPYLYERESTNCENLPETHEFLKKLRAHVDKKFENRMLLAEANQWPEDAVTYFGEDNECHMAFHFPIMPRLFMALHMEDRHPIIDILEQTPAIPEGCQWAVFLRNHDELTLEMVTDEERDYMIGVYARDRRARINLGIRRRLAPLLDNNRRRIELMNALLFSLPGTPVLYYGDEIGMGDNVYLGDRDGVRTPMQWSPDRNAGFSRANPQQLILPTVVDPEYHYEAVNVETQQGNTSSLLWWTKRIIALRKQHLAFGRGTLEPLLPRNRKVLAFLRRYQDEVLLIVANLSRFSQYVELDLSEFKGRRPLALFGQVEFPPIGNRPYLLTLAPHNFFWFSLPSNKGAGRLEATFSARDHKVIEIEGSWEDLLHPRGRGRSALEKALPDYMKTRRWFRGKAREIKGARIIDALGLGADAGDAELVLVEISYVHGDPETYVLVLGFAPGKDMPENAIARLCSRGKQGKALGSIVDASADPRVAADFLELVLDKKRLKGSHYELVGVPDVSLPRRGKSDKLPRARALSAEQSNSSWIYGNEFVGKLLRRVEEGESVELELLREIERVQFPHASPLLGHLELRHEKGAISTLGIVQRFVPNEGDAWAFTLDNVQRFFDRVLTEKSSGQTLAVPRDIFVRANRECPQNVRDYIGGYLDVAKLLGQRTAELHIALASGKDQPNFAPDAYGSLSKRSFYQSLRNLASRSFDALRETLPKLTPADAELAKSVLKRERQIRGRLKHVLERELGGQRIRCHGDYHLGQILYTGKDFVIIDFEGEPLRSLTDRRRKRSPMADVAGMLRSFHYAVYGVLSGELPGSQTRPEDVPVLELWAPVWYAWVASSFLGTYLKTIEPAQLLPTGREALELLLDVHLVEKSLYELNYELNNRPTWVRVPLRGILDVLDADAPK
jgi:maltose alpha-D-glucosyltransferase/alpha-amylase